MSCVFEEIKCPKCGGYKKIEERQEIIFCSNLSCGFYFDRQGNKREYDPMRASSAPFSTGLSLLSDNLK